MNIKEEKVIEYFSAPKNHFWRWADNGEVIETKLGNTICYRDELMEILRNLAPHGLPPLANILWVLLACQNKWENIREDEKRNLFQVLTTLNRQAVTANHIPPKIKAVMAVIEIIDVIHQLPKELRARKKRVHLLQELFKYSENAILPSNVKALLEDFSSGQFDLAIFNAFKVLTPNRFQKEVALMVKVSNVFPNIEVLKARLLSGLDDTPDPIDLEIPETETEELTLLQQLKKDHETVGIARLCERLMAGIHIPMHSRGASNQSFGGVSDITNRGDFDKLLLSELAYDDTTLMVRLANNEAMYLRREELPSNLNRERIILLDATLKMWGVPRAFAISAALACNVQDKNISETSAFTLGGENFTTINLQTKKGVLESLQHLYPQMDCGKALFNFFEKNPHAVHAETVFITSEQNFKNKKFSSAFTKIKKSLRFLITVNRDGDLHFYEYVNGNRKQLSKTKYDLDKLLFTKELKPKRKKQNDIAAIYREEVMPLYFPTIGMQLDSRKMYSGIIGVIGITDDNRVLHWKKAYNGAVELYENIEDELRHFGYHSSNPHRFHIFIRNKPQHPLMLKLYSFHLKEHTVKITDYSKTFGQSYGCAFNNGKFEVYTNQGVKFIDVTNHPVSSDKSEYQNNKTVTTYDSPKIRRFIKSGYTPIRKGKSIGINEHGYLVINRYQLYLQAFPRSRLTNHAIQFKRNTSYLKERIRFERKINPTGQIFYMANWDNGSQAILDAKGMLHLKSANQRIPEITVTMTIGHTPGLWASNGVVAGGYHFVREGIAKRISEVVFYEKYIQQFIDAL
ncbi:MAG: hypothetical protein AAF573_06925 [Bacteroidota bacterium]